MITAYADDHRIVLNDAENILSFSQLSVKSADCERKEARVSRSKSESILVALGAAASACTAAILMSAASAPTARADDFSDIVSDVQQLTAASQTDYTGALTAFETGTGAGYADGLEDLFAATNNGDLLVSDEILLGSVEALQNQSIDGIGPLSPFVPEPDIATAVADLQNTVAMGQQYLADIPTELSAGDYSFAVEDYINGSFYTLYIPGEQLLSAAVDQLLGI
jgi:hypothetical protein